MKCVAILLAVIGLIHIVKAFPVTSSDNIESLNQIDEGETEELLGVDELRYYGGHHHGRFGHRPYYRHGHYGNPYRAHYGHRHGGYYGNRGYHGG